MNKNIKNYAIILASGSGSRFMADKPKQFVLLGDNTILAHTVEVFQNCELVDEIIVATNAEYINIVCEFAKNCGYTKVSKIIPGGETRKDSSYNAVMSITDNEANIIIHDCARPLVSQQIIKNCIEELNKGTQALTCAVALTDTIVETDGNIIKNIPQRASFKRVQTPQGFKLSIIKKAHELSINDTDFTDDCGLVLKNKLADIKVIDGDYENIKITYPQDLVTAEEILKKRKL